MSSTEVILCNIKNLCYCCQENTSFTLLWRNEGSNDVSYGQMLQSCFSLQLSEVTDTDVICYQCVRDLQVAVEFRNKVAGVRNKLQNNHQAINLNKLEDFSIDLNVKQENNDFDYDDYDNDVKELAIIKKEKKEPPKAKLIINAEDFTKKDDGQYSCSKCDKTSDYQQIIQHLNEVHYYTCSECEDKFQTKEQLSEHKKVHKTICNSCGVEFSSVVALNEHRNGSCNILMSLRNLGVLKDYSVPKKDDNFSCSDCSKQFLSKRALLLHQRIHKATKKPAKDEKKSKINDTSQGKKISENLPTVNTPRVRKVKYKVLPGDFTKAGKIYTCNKCQRTATDYSVITRHINNVHYQNPAYNCCYCKETFRSLHKLNVHKFTIHDDSGARFLCTACGKAFYTVTSLNAHSKSYHMLGDVLKCPECDFQTYLKQGMRHHMAKHNKKVQYFCSFCPKTFTRYDSHKYHERIHTGDKRKVCKICGEKFVQRTSLKYHIIKHHPNDTIP